MQEFWAMNDLEKLILVLKILLVGFGWGTLIFSSVLIILLTVDYLKEWIDDWHEERALKKLQNYAEMDTVRLPVQRRGHWADQTTDVFKLAEEIYK